MTETMIALVIRNDNDEGIEVEPALRKDTIRWRQALNRYPTVYIQYDDLAEAKDDWLLTDEDVARLRDYEIVRVHYPEDKFERLLRGQGLEE
jgi:hypothetical protein